MRPTTRTAIIALAIGAALFSQPRAQAEVRLFEEAPSVEQLRAILIPESRPGMARRIEIPRRDTLEAAKPIQPAAAATTSPAAPQPMATETPSAPAPIDAPATAPAAEQSAAPAVAKEEAPAKPAPAAGDVTVVGFRINFAFNSAVIPPEHFSQLDRVAELLRQEPSLSLAVEGHTDAVGGDEYNIELSRRRAVAVVRYLAEHGVEAKRLLAVGKGKTEPLVANPLDGRNRRVQFLRISPDAMS